MAKSRMSQRLKVMGLATAAAAMLACSAYAKIVLKLPITDFLPGIDAMGNVDVMNEFEAFVSIAISTKSGKTRVKASAQVDNESGVKQSYENDADVLAATGLDGPPWDLTRSKYRVSATGKAKFSASGNFDLDSL